jgi:hypothetical protein
LRQMKVVKCHTKIERESIKGKAGSHCRVPELHALDKELNDGW